MSRVLGEDLGGGKVEVHAAVKVYVAVKDNVRVDVEVLIEVYDPVTTAQEAVFYSA